MHILRCMGSKFCVKFQRAPLKFHTKFWTHTPQNVHFTIFIFCVRVTISLNCDVISLSETALWCSLSTPRWCLKQFTTMSAVVGMGNWYRYSLVASSASSAPNLWLNAGLLLIWPLATNLAEFWITMTRFYQKMSMNKWWPVGLR